MFLTKSTRAIVALVALVSLLACQAVWSSHASARLFAATGAAAITPVGCHSAGDPVVPEHSAPRPCDSAQAPSDAYKLPILSFVALPIPAVAVEVPVPELRLAGLDLRPLAGAPPPVRLLHCKFLN